MTAVADQIGHRSPFLAVWADGGVLVDRPGRSVGRNVLADRDAVVVAGSRGRRARHLLVQAWWTTTVIQQAWLASMPPAPRRQLSRLHQHLLKLPTTPAW